VSPIVQRYFDYLAHFVTPKDPLRSYSGIPISASVQFAIRAGGGGVRLHHLAGGVRGDEPDRPAGAADDADRDLPVPGTSRGGELRAGVGDGYVADARVHPWFPGDRAVARRGGGGVLGGRDR